jgi:hypothetical protein
MSRPKSIVRFELAYLTSLAISAANTALTWSDAMSTVEAAKTEEMFGPWFMPLITVFGFTLSLLLWYFTARVASNVARWVLVIFFLLGLLSFAMTWLWGIPPTGLSGALAIAALVLNALAVGLLFRPDAARWFGARG